MNFHLKGKESYYQVMVNTAEKTAIITPFGTFQFDFMSFWFKKAGTTFQQIIYQIFGDLDFVFVYLYDILIT